MDDGNGGRSRRCDYGGETNSSPAGLTLGGILSIKQTPPYRIHERTLLDLIRDDQSCRKETKKMWKMLREKFRLKLAGPVCTTTVPTHVHVTGDSNRVVSPPVNDASSVTTVVDAESVNVQTEVLVEERERTSPEEDGVAGGGGGGEGGEPTAARMSLMSLLEVEGSVYFDDDDDDEHDDDEVEEEDEAVVDGGGDGDDGGGGGYRYNNCCVCMVRHKGAAFIPCGHTFCRLCSRELFVKRASCPLCNNFILEILDIF